MHRSVWWEKSLAALLDDGSAAEESERRLALLDVAEFLALAAEESSPDDLAEMCEESYVHANGFEKISLPALPSCAQRLRVHIWPEESRGPRSVPDAHNHRWSLASRILVGSLRNTVFEFREEATGEYLRYRHIQRMPLPGYSFEYAGRVALVAAADHTYDAGETYRLPPEAIHVAESASGGLAATLAVELAPVRRVTDVFTAAGGRPIGQVLDPPRFRPEEVRAKLADLRDRLAGQR